MTHHRYILLVLVLLGAGLLARPLPAAGTAQTDPRCFAETQQCIAGRLRTFWEQNGGLPVFGYPITPQQEEVVEGQALQVQWFERVRLEWHPTLAPPYDVLLGRLGIDRLARQGRDAQSFPPEPPQPGCRFFAETQHNVCGPLLAAWQAQGLVLDALPAVSAAESLALFGLPLSPQRPELVAGQALQVQWFERARFELHPQNPPPSDVLLGLLGRELGTPLAGRIAFVDQQGANAEIYLINADGSGRVNLTQDAGSDYSPAWSPDGTRLAFGSQRGDNADIYVMHADGSALRRLTTDPAIDGTPVWSPDGQRLAFESNRTGRKQLYVMQSDGAHQRQVVDMEGRHASDPRWAPDGTRLVFWTGPFGDDAIWLVQPDGSGLTQVAVGAWPQWSPDGTQVVFRGREGITLLEVASGTTRLLTAGERPLWAPTGTQLAFADIIALDGSSGQHLRPLFVLPLGGGARLQLTHPPDPIPGGDVPATWSPDGQHLAFVRTSTYLAAPGTIYIAAADGSGERELTPGNQPAWQPQP